MPNVEEDLVDGLRVTQGERGFVLTRTFFCTDLTGSTPMEKLLQPYLLYSGGTAHTGANIPRRLDQLTVLGVDFWCKDINVAPDPPADATVTAVYDTESPPVAGFGPTVIETGSTLELAETKFDAVNRALPFASRAAIIVNPPPAYANDPPQFPTVPYWANKSTRIWTRQESSDPQPLADQYVGKTNSSTWMGKAANTVLCVEIFGRNAGDGIWVTRYVFAYDPHGLFRAVSFWRDENGNVGFFDPSTGEGVTESDVQGEEDFNDLSL